MDLPPAHLKGGKPGRVRARRVALVTLIAASLAAVSAARACGDPDGAVRVAAVDDRLDLVLADGRTVRLAGVAFPQPGASPDVVGEARDLLASRFVGREATLLRLARGTDRWGQILGDVAIEPPAGEPGTAASTALAMGYARVAPSFEARACAPERLRVEEEARQAGLGLWAGPHAVILATDAEAIRRSDGHFVVIEGTVRRVGIGRTRLYLDLVPKGGPTIVVPRKLETAFARAGHPVDAAAGQTIRVRGALDARLGPRLEVSEPAMIEFLGRPDAPGGDRPHP